MKKLSLFHLLILFSCFSSCEEVIQLDLNSAAGKYVIEANLSTKADDAMLRLSKTKKLSDDNTFVGISGAQVSIVDEDGNTSILPESNKKGIYTKPSLMAITGKTYYLTVKIAGQVFTAQSTVPPAVIMTDAYPVKMNLASKPQWYSQVKYTDPPGVKNFYRFIEHRNTPSATGVFVTNDELTDGKAVVQTIFSSEHSINSRINEGEQVHLEFQCIDEAAYHYWSSISAGAKGNSDSASPSNPISNIKGGAIGYFSAHTSQSKTYLVK